MIVHFDGFDYMTYDRLRDRYTYAATGIDQGTLTSGRYYHTAPVIFNTGFGRAEYQVDIGGHSEIFVGINLMPIHTTGASIIADSEFFVMRNPSESGGIAKKLAFGIRSNGRLQVYREGSTNNFTGTLIWESAPGLFSLNTWVQLQIRAKFPAGLWIKVENVDVLDNNLLVTSTNGIDAAGVFGIKWESFGNAGMAFDDYWIVNTALPNPVSWLGPARVFTVLPRADRIKNEWTPNAGALHYQRLVEKTIPPYPDYTSYLTASAPGPKEEYFLHEPLFTPGDTLALQHNLWVSNPTGASSILKAMTFHNTFFESPNISTHGTSSWKLFRYLQQQDPELLSAWEDLRLENFRFGVKYVSGADVRMTRFAIEKLINNLAYGAGSGYWVRGRFR